MGFHLNQFAMSLMKPENRAAFKADEAAYLDNWQLTPAQREGVLQRDYNRLLDEGGNIYFLAKFFSTDGQSFLQAVGTMTGMTHRGLSGDDGRRRPQPRGRALAARAGGARGRRRCGRRDHQLAGHARGGPLMARITAGVASSHIPAIGAALDNGKPGEPYWQPVFAGFDWVKRFEADEKPDVVILVSQRSRLGIRREPDPDLRDRLRREASSRPTKAGGRARCRWSRAIPTSPGTSRRAASSTSST